MTFISSISEAQDTGPNVGQGTISGAVVSSVNLDQGMKEYFHDEEDNDKSEGKDKEVDEKVMYADIKLYPFLFQDDIMNLSKSIDSAQSAIIKIENLLDSKLLDFNISKYSVLIAGNKKSRQKALLKTDSSPLLLCGTKLKQATAERYLGCWLAGTAADSVALTVAKRLGPAYQALYQEEP